MEKTAPPVKTSSADASLAAVQRRVNKIVIVAAVVMAAIVAAAVYGTIHYVDQERQREAQHWQTRLAIVADSRAAAVNEWVAQNFDSLRELAENQSLQLYLTELGLAKGDARQGSDAAALTSYLRTLLIATAERTGFKPPPAAGEVNANVARAGVAGLTVVDVSGRAIASSEGMPALAGPLRAAITKALGGHAAIMDVQMGPTNLPIIGFALPVFAVQGSDNEVVGAVAGVRVLGRDLFDRLKQPGELSNTAETYLVRLSSSNQVEYLSPLADRSPPLSKSLDAGTPDLMDAYALAKPGGFAIKRGYAADQVLAVSRPIADLPWVLVRKVAYAEALAEMELRFKGMLTVFLLIIVGVTVTIIAVWRHGSSVRATEASERHRIAAERFQDLLQFNRLLTDSQPTHIVSVNAENKISFSNRPFADHYGIPITDIRYKELSSVVGPVKARIFDEINRRVLETRTRHHQVHRFEDPDGVHVLISDHIYIPADGRHPHAVLMVINDVTELTQEKERSEATMRQLVDTLVGMVDRRDPYSANHSIRVAEVARTIAVEMGLSEAEVATVDIAASLSGISKLFIPVETLSKTGNLTAEEKAVLASSNQVSADLLKGVTFSTPVVDTIRQMSENWDGGGPLGLKEGAILATARILAVANAFVDMASGRPHRAALSFEKIISSLIEQSGTRFDRSPVSALLNILDNRDGRKRWAHFGSPAGS